MTRGAGWGATWLGEGVTSTEGLLVVRAFWFDMTMVPLPSVDRWTPAKAVFDKKTVLPAQMSTRLSKILPPLTFSSAAALRGVILFLKTLKAYPNFKLITQGTGRVNLPCVTACRVLGPPLGKALVFPASYGLPEP